MCRIQVSDHFSDHTTDLGKNLQNTNREIGGFISSNKRSISTRINCMGLNYLTRIIDSDFHEFLCKTLLIFKNI